MSSFHKGTSSVHLYFSTLMYILVVQNVSLVKIKLLGGEATVPGEKKKKITKYYEKDMGITWKRKKNGFKGVLEGKRYQKGPGYECAPAVEMVLVKLPSLLHCL